MKRSLSSFEITLFSALAIIFGAGFGVFAHGYWLVDLFPVDGRRLFYSTILSGLLGMAGYALFFRWARSRLAGFPRQGLLGLTGLSLLAGTFLFFTVTDRWQKPVRYASLLLPDHTLQISIRPTQPSGEIHLLWFNTSLGDVSFDDLDYEGWKRENERFVLTNFSDNRIRWTGKTGAEAQIVFQSSSDNGDAIVAWDGRAETRPLLERKNNFARAFTIPFYASKGWILLLGALNFTTLAFPLSLAVWERRSETLQALRRAISEAPQRFTVYEAGTLVLAILLALALRVPNLGSLFPTIDEYQQIIAAKQIALGAPWADVYPRSFWLVTLPISLALRVFGYEIWAARLTGVIFNVLAIVPLYLIGRRINRPVAVLSTLLYATSPLVIALSRDAREYAYYPFYFYWTVYGMIVLLERIRERFRIGQAWQAFFMPSQILLGLGLVVLPIHALYIDTFSTLRLILIAYVALGIFLPFVMDLKNWNTIVLTVVAAGVALVGAYTWSARSSLSLNFDSSPINYFFPNPPQQWYYNRLVVIPAILLLGATVASLLMLRRNFVPLFVTALYACFLGFFVFSSVGHSEPRHLNAAHLWYVILIAFGLYVFWLFLQTFPFFGKVSTKTLTVFVLIALSINIRQILSPLTSHDPYVPITGHYHPQLGELHEFLLAASRKEDVLISTYIYSGYVTWTDEPAFSATYIVRLDTELEKFSSIIARHDSGWIVLDKIWIDRFIALPFESFPKNDALEYVGLFGDEHLWRWPKK